MTTKLTNYMRERIAEAVVQHRFNEPALAIVTRRAALAAKVYDDLYSPADQKKMAGLPIGWLPEDNDISVQFGSGANYTQIAFSGAVYGAVARALVEPLDRINRRVASSHVRGCAKSYEPTHPFVAEYETIKADTAALITEIEAAERQAKAAIASASTVKRLIEMWPEIEPFAKDYQDEKSPPLPALPTQQLNAMFKLPVTEAALPA